MNINEIDNRITKLEKLMEDINDKLWMNYNSGVPSEDVTDEILESVRKMTEKKTRRDLYLESFRLHGKLSKEKAKVLTVLDQIETDIAIINFHQMSIHASKSTNVLDEQAHNFEFEQVLKKIAGKYIRRKKMMSKYNSNIQKQ
jgi:glucan phosphorylase